MAQKNMEDPLAFIDGMQSIAENLGGMRKVLMSQGFEGDDASKIIVAIFQQNAAETWAKVMGIDTDES